MIALKPVYLSRSPHRNVRSMLSVENGFLLFTLWWVFKILTSIVLF